MEFTLRAIILGILLSIILAAANAYLGLKVGMTVSASIPAAVISFAVLRMFRQSNVLENNIVQTAASAGESLAAGMIFTLPALLLLGVWDGFHYWQSTILITLGGIIGVLVAVPIRRALLSHKELTFPEGVATAKVLKAGYTDGRSIKLLLIGALIAAVFKFKQVGLGLFASSYTVATQSRAVLGFGLDLSPALLAVGYIVKLNIAVLMLIGGAIVWLVIMPLYSTYSSVVIPAEVASSSIDTAFWLWSKHLRFIGVGAMLVGGLWVLFIALKPVIRTIFEASQETTNRHDDMPMHKVSMSFLLMTIPVYASSYYFTGDALLSFIVVLFVMIASLLFSTVAAYMAGLVGSSNNPVSGVTIATVFISAFIVYFYTGSEVLHDDQLKQASSAALTIFIAALVCCAAAISGDTMQDLKAGQILGARPRHQQWAQIIGVIAAGLILLPVLQVLYEAYGIAGHMPREGMDVQQALQAPQATLMQSVALGVFAQNLPWDLMFIGAVLALLFIISDSILKNKGVSFRLPVLAVAVGMYLPITLSVPIFAGGLIAYLHRRATQPQQNNTILFASGLIAGEALLSLVLAIPFAFAQSNELLRIVDSDTGIPTVLLGGLAWLLVCGVLWYVGNNREKVQ